LLYKSDRWKKDTRPEIIIRDDGCDLGVEGYDIHGKILVHHMNPITIEDIELERDCVYDPEFLICTTMNTHNAIHYGNESLLPELPVERRRNDTCPWR
jgi:predicted HNH restriction endonuclease